MNPGSFGEIAKSFTLPEDQVPIFEEYVNLTSKPINRPYYQTFKMVENWQTHTIIRRYNQCTKDNAGDIPDDILWWYLRKEELKRN
jgi:virulence-associated protein VagC